MQKITNEMDIEKGVCMNAEHHQQELEEDEMVRQEPEQQRDPWPTSQPHHHDHPSQEAVTRPSSIRFIEESQRPSTRPASLTFEDVRRLNTPPKARWDWARHAVYDTLDAAWKLWPLALFSIIGMTNLIGLGMLVYGTFGTPAEDDDMVGSPSQGATTTTVTSTADSQTSITYGGGAGIIMSGQYYKMMGLAMYMGSVISCFIWLRRHIHRRQMMRAQREAAMMMPGAVGA